MIVDGGVNDGRGRADIEAAVTPTDLRPSLDEHHTEPPVGSRQSRVQRQVAGLEDPQGRTTCGKCTTPRGNMARAVTAPTGEWMAPEVSG